MRFTAVVAALAALGCSSVLSAPVHNIQEIFARNDLSDLNIRDGIEALYARDLELYVPQRWSRSCDDSDLWYFYRGNQLHKRVLPLTGPRGIHPETIDTSPKGKQDKDEVNKFGYTAKEWKELRRQLDKLEPLHVPEDDD